MPKEDQLEFEGEVIEAELETDNSSETEVAEEAKE